MTDESGSNPSLGGDQPSVSPSQAEQAARRFHIAIVEDNVADVFLIRETIEAANIQAELQILRDGEQAIEFFTDAAKLEGPHTDLVVLDINLPKKQGGEVLQYLRQSPVFSRTPVIVVTTSDSERDRQQMLALGANGFFTKPSDYEGFLKLGVLIRDMLGASCKGQAS